MTAKTDPDSSEKPSRLPDVAKVKRDVIVACTILFGFTFVLLGAELVVPSITGFSQALLAIALLIIPGLALRKSQLRVEDLGTTMGPIRPMLTHTLIALCIVFPIFVAGFHIFQTSMLGATPQWSLDEIQRWNQEIEHAPANPCAKSENGPIAWIDRHGLWVLGPSDTFLSLRGQTLPESARRVSCTEEGKAQAGTSIEKRNDDIRSSPPLRGLLVDLKENNSVDLNVHTNGEELPSPLRLGRYGDNAETISASKTSWWIVTYLIIHLGLIALPEDWFFRGYLQGRLDQLWGTPRRFLGANLGWGFIVSSLAFAALHPLLLPGFHRLLVFFPALFFGWLRARTGNIGAAVLVHALSNLLLAIISRMYGVS